MAVTCRACYDLTDPAVRPPTQYRCRKINAITIGIMEINAPEVSRFQICSDAEPAELLTCHCDRPTVIGNKFGLVSTTEGRKKLFQAPTTESNNTVVIAGVMIGSDT